MKKLQSIEEYKNVIQEKNTILMFSADWCPDCRIIEPILPELEQENTEFTFYYVDRDEYIELCQELDVYGIPSFVAFNQGKEAGRFVNKDRKKKKQIQEFIDTIHN
ncbi:thioredoxin family protein [Metabacillus litoralis]|uniref:Thioredoxin family protein n=1 Tax=Metabacillus litoralis TaxID=152268 RepID=A0A5C6W049_9BACI|nr:thioredoxin family protein [Metabacillus litoralis]TXC90249.1 thioredoxin family protein [Metabacillus litoralis]